MSAPRDVRLLRVPSLKTAHRAVALVGCHADPVRAAACVVLVPSRAAADELRRTLERCWVVDGWRPPDAASAVAGVDGGVNGVHTPAWPRLLTRAEWYASMQEAAGGDARMLSAPQREVLLSASARDAMTEAIHPPFRLGPGLVAQMLDFYDALRRNLRSVDDFDRLLSGALEPSADLDRGAARMLQQTRFLAESFRRFEARCDALGVLDEHRLRQRLSQGRVDVGIRQLVVTLLDQAADPEGLWPADFDLIARIPGLERVDVIVTEGQLATGVHERLHERLPGLIECRTDLGDDPSPVLLVPGDGEAPHFTSRDREDELAGALGRMVSRSATVPTDPAAEDRQSRLDGCVLVYQRPLPYLYLARQLLEAARLPYEAIDALPLAAEPYVAAFDLAISFVVSGYTRATTVALLGSPHLQFVVNGTEVTRRHVASLDARLADLGYLGGRARLQVVTAALAEEACAPAAIAAARAADELDPLLATGPPSVLLTALIDFLDRHGRVPTGDDPAGERQARARDALRATLRDLRDAEARFGDHATDTSTLRATVKRWIEGQTFAPRTGLGGLRLTDARAAAYGDVDRVHLLGLVEGEWPAASARNIFFPIALLRELGWTGEADRLASARAAFVDLLHLARRETSVSNFSLEDDAVVRPAAFLEELDDAGLATMAVTGSPADLRATTVPGGEAAAWAELRAGRTAPDDRRFHGFTDPRPRERYSVTAIETYLACPFKYFAARDLGLDEDTAGDGTLTALERGRLVHEVVEAFFSSGAPGTGPPGSPDWLRAARQRFRDVVEARLATVPEGERALERRRFLGTAAIVGICDRVLAVEASAEGTVIERLLEYDLSSVYPLVVGGESTTRLVRGKADRIDLLAGGFLRILDYKSGKAPRIDRSLQLPVYAACAERQLEGRHGQRWTVSEAAYVPLAGQRTLVPVIADATGRDAAVARAERLLIRALEAIEAGRFPPQPSELRLCTTCAFAAICRKDYVDVDAL